MDENKIVLNDGIEIIGGILYTSYDDTLSAKIPGEDIVQAALLFSNAEKTSKMIYYNGIRKHTYTGYTTLVSISADSKEHTTLIKLSGENVNQEFEYTVPEEYLPESMRTYTAEVTENE